MTNQSLHRLSIAPIFMIGAGSIVMGLLWIFYPEPWLLDQKANEILLQTSYETLLAIEGNEFLGVYLRGMYGFFGLWIGSVGLMVLAYLKATGFASKPVRHLMYAALGITLAIAMVLIIIYVPSSYFLWLNLGFALSIAVSLWASGKLEDTR